MDETVEQLSIDLAEEIEASEADRTFVDPRSIPTRFSLLKQFALSPAHYLEACQRPQDDSLAARLAAMSTVKDRRDALRFGSAIHYLLLGERRKVAKFTGAVRRGKAWDKFQVESAANGVEQILNVREYDLALQVANAILRHKEACRLLFDGTIREQRIDWEWLGKATRATPDARTANYIADLKTTISAEPRAFIRQGSRLFYHVQAAIYATAVEAIGGSTPGDCYLIAVEKSRPTPVTIFRLPEKSIVQGHKSARLWMEELLACEAENTWPEYSESVVPFDLPEWMTEEQGPVEIEIDGKRVAV